VDPAESCVENTEKSLVAGAGAGVARGFHVLVGLAFSISKTALYT